MNGKHLIYSARLHLPKWSFDSEERTVDVTTERTSLFASSWKVLLDGSAQVDQLEKDISCMNDRIDRGSIRIGALADNLSIFRDRVKSSIARLEKSWD